jgi:hypothetical protein
MDILNVLALSMTGSGGHGQSLLQLLEVYTRREPVSRVTALPIIVVGTMCSLMIMSGYNMEDFGALILKFDKSDYCSLPPICTFCLK